MELLVEKIVRENRMVKKEKKIGCIFNPSKRFHPVTFCTVYKNTMPEEK